MKKEQSDYIVVGAGYSGLATAVLLQKRGFQVKLLEAHHLIGGCASYYKRKDFVFDVGATTFSGILPNQPLGRLFSELNIKPDLIKIDPGMIIQMENKKIIRYSNPKKWLEEVNIHFPEKNINLFWEMVFRNDDLVWELIDQNPKLPPKNILDLLSLLKINNLSKIVLLPHLFQSVSTVLKSLQLKSSELIRFLNEQLLITTQSRVGDSPMLTASMGLAYPQETYYPVGGMFKPAELMLEKFKELGGEVVLKEKVTKIVQDKDSYRVETKKGNSYLVRGVFSSIPIWNMAEITEGKMQNFFIRKSKKNSNAQGAFTINFAIESKLELESLYYQIHSRSKIPYCEAGAFFVSFSHIDDRLKAKEGFRTVTISTHTNPSEWLGLSKEVYNQKKEITMKLILSEFDYAFPELSAANKLFVLSGTPDTFEFYTHRKNGFVGGIPHSVKSNLLFMTPNFTPFKNLYLIGDTVFPGQGMPAVILGARNSVARVTEV